MKWFSENASSNNFLYSVICSKLKPVKTPSGQTKSVFLFLSGLLYLIRFDIFSPKSLLDKLYFKSKPGEIIFV